MNYKILSIVLGLLLAAAFVFIITVCMPSHDDPSSSVPRSVSAGSIDPALIAAWQKAKGPVKERGRFFKLPKLVIDAYRYRELRKKDSLLSSNPYAFLFGMDQMRELISRYDQYNRGPIDPADSIHGVRVFLVLNQTTDSLGVKHDHFDVMLSPVKKNGKNLFEIGDPNTDNELYKMFGEPEFYLNTSSPCPDMCN